MDVSARIRDQYPAFSRTRRRIADLVLEYPEKCSFLSLKDFAAQAGVTEVTVLSFCRELGFGNFSDFRRELQDSLIATVDLRERMKLLRDASANDSALYEQLVRSTRQLVDVTYANNDVSALAAFTGKLRAAKHVFLTAHNITEKHARSLCGTLLYHGIDARVLDIQDREAIFSLLTMWPTEECLLLAIGISPIGKSTLAITEFARKLGMEIVAITDKATSPLARAASASLLCSVRMLNVYNSTATIFLMQDMISAFLAAGGEKGLPSGRTPQELAALRRSFLDYSTLA